MAVKRRWKLPVFNPLLIAIILVIGFLLLFRVDYEAYNSSAKYLSYLLTPATVSLAIPLYQKLELLKKNGLAILVSVFSGAVASMGYGDGRDRRRHEQPGDRGQRGDHGAGGGGVRGVLLSAPLSTWTKGSALQERPVIKEGRGM